MQTGLKMIAVAVAIFLALPILKESRSGPSVWHRSAAMARTEGVETQMAPRAPAQTALPALRRSTVNDHDMAACARFRVEALVLSRRDYRFDRTAAFSATDLALGWGPMSNPALVQEIKITQSGRFYHWRPNPDARLTPAEIKVSSANMHLILQTAAQRAAMKQIGKGDVVIIEGYLVDVTSPRGGQWRSSRVRTDGGAGACEIILVERIRRKAPEPAGDL
ncbi:hypothetical protein M4578_01700 [Salipiger sp. P9]|uniref:hypothetical protein n=1 Tax=Salipiger pentaromativorans TaxID=2943193 RepID=UPI00215763F0|nr:hypothetical protein [Salipiger pentaromativorans]MCR8546527.1 hypothetical protein [Salipiger pentaromativorans]